jgi:hypothetical protein
MIGGKMVRKFWLLGIAITLLAASASAGNIVANGNFLGILPNTPFPVTGWPSSNTCGTCTDAGWFVGNFNFSDPGAPTDTTNSAATGCEGAACNDATTGDWISQVLTTDPTMTYTLTFLVDPGTSDGSPLELDVLWAGAVLTTITDLTEDTWVLETFSGLMPTGTATTLEFTGRDDAGVLAIDDIAVNGAAGGPSSVPEPASLVLIGGGLLGIGTMLRRRRSA